MSIIDKEDLTDSTVSYIAGGGLITLAQYADIQNFLSIYALAIGAVVITIRLLFDSIGLYRRLRDKNHGREKN